MNDRTYFAAGQLYRATDGRLLFVMSGNSTDVDVWQNLAVGRHERVGVMTREALADLLGR